MRNLAFFGGACAVSVSVLLACSSESPSSGGSSGSSGETDKDAGNFKRDGSNYDSSPSPESGLGELLFRPDRVYTGVDGTHTFKIPIAVYDSDTDLSVTASDGTALTLVKAELKNPVDPDGVTDNGKYYMITALKPGAYTLTASSKGRRSTASVTVASYPTTQWANGDARYNNGMTSGATRACKTCHVDGAAIDHSPAALATATDQEIGIIITTGVKPGPSVIMVPGEPGGHKWTVTADEKEGLVAYLRALNPRGFK